MYRLCIMRGFVFSAVVQPFSTRGPFPSFFFEYRCLDGCNLTEEPKYPSAFKVFTTTTAPIPFPFFVFLSAMLKLINCVFSTMCLSRVKQFLLIGNSFIHLCNEICIIMRYSNKSNDHFYNNKENILFFKKTAIWSEILLHCIGCSSI